MNHTKLKWILALIACLVIALPIGGYAYWTVGRPVKPPSSEPTRAPDTEPIITEPFAIPVEPAEGESVYRISAEESLARFTLDEVLRGEPTTVVGVTDHVSGEIALDRSKLDEARIGTIRINARTFVTDSEQRNRAIVRLIFRSETDAHEFIEFTPTRIANVPREAENGTVFPMDIEGDLRISGITHAVAFQGFARFVSDDRLEGSVETVLRYAEFGLTIPQLPFLANVDEEVKLAFDFVAIK